MKILYLGYPDSKVYKHLITDGNEVVSKQSKLVTWDLFKQDFELIVSYGYRYKLPSYILEKVPRAVNLHISYLPWNRGACPTFWSLIKGTPQGVTIHEIDEGIDTGPILLQEEVYLGSCQYLSDAINLCKYRIEDLFVKNWPALKAGSITGVKQDLDQGSLQSLKDLDEWTRHCSVKELQSLVDQMVCSGG